MPFFRVDADCPEQLKHLSLHQTVVAVQYCAKSFSTYKKMYTDIEFEVEYLVLAVGQLFPANFAQETPDRVYC